MMQLWLLQLLQHIFPHMKSKIKEYLLMEELIQIILNKFVIMKQFVAKFQQNRFLCYLQAQEAIFQKSLMFIKIIPFFTGLKTYKVGHLLHHKAIQIFLCFNNFNTIIKDGKFGLKNQQNQMISVNKTSNYCKNQHISIQKNSIILMITY